MAKQEDMEFIGKASAWADWQLELEVWGSQGRRVDMWWRDDDAGAPTASLARLMDLSERSGVPLALAVIPNDAVVALTGMPGHMTVLQHGVDHVNRNIASQKKCEFSESEATQVMLERLVQGRTRLQDLFGARALPVLAPPWNRFPLARIPILAQAAYRGLSGFAPRRLQAPMPAFVQVNTHVDIIDWHAGRGFVGESRALDFACRVLRARRLGETDATEPLGWLTHHAVHDEGAWRFMAQLFERTRAMPHVRWMHGPEVFGLGS